MCDVPPLRARLDAHPRVEGHVRIIEDRAHCFEGERDAMKPGQAGDAAVFSFYATKNVTCGEGGAMIHMCPNYFVPYEPHFGIPLIPFAPRATQRFFRAR